MSVLWNMLYITPCALFRKFPVLASRVSYISLCDLPTPVTKLSNFGLRIGYSDCYIKRDDLTGRTKNGHRLYGGNKPRKLEWLLADAKQKQARTIITYGCVGSNHALATATYAHELGMDTILMLKHQPNSDVVRQNLILDFELHAQLCLFPDNQSRDRACADIVERNPYAYRIPTGGSNTIGTLGFVNAACELYEQIVQDVMPEPDVIYLPIGSCATTAGLLLGLALHNSRTKIIAVAVEPEAEPGTLQQRTQELFVETNRLLHMVDSTIPLVNFPAEQLIINTKFCGTNYGTWTQESAFVIKLFKELEEISLEGTYSAKPINACIDDIANGLLTSEIVLIWNTYCGLDFSFVTGKYAYQELPHEFHQYFEQDVQVTNKLMHFR